MWRTITLAILVLTGCEEARLLTGDQSNVSVEFGTYRYIGSGMASSGMAKAARLANGHCRSFNKRAVLTGTEPIGEDLVVAYFECR